MCNKKETLINRINNKKEEIFEYIKFSYISSKCRNKPLKEYQIFKNNFENNLEEIYEMLEIFYKQLRIINYLSKKENFKELTINNIYNILNQN